MSLILELQEECLSQASTTRLLRKAHLVAFKLGLTEFDSWITTEMNGYTDSRSVPKYRQVAGTLKARAPEFVGGFTVNLSKQPIEVPVVLPISVVDAAIDEPGSETQLAPNLESANALIGDAPQLKGSSLFVTIPKSEMKKIPDGIRDKVLQWALELERADITGEGLSFTEKEKEAAKTLAAASVSVLIQGDNNGSVQIQQKSSDASEFP
ncbi:hypothetical protein [Parafannyhessea umbonata]|jgi:hypothetical protein|uniref:AbiTii domain-containing protein n=1 Tax=Parafannyhessea umbonata TaxID=604330 RepID=A0A6N7WXE5_9ACTN|nr:hypothetical protein [Parafannyhessea umbonata]MST61310.1 hypothetical protein [Parafannyhessea umbonata]